MEGNVGKWFRRIRLPGQGLTSWHLCESEIADRLVTRCGREMHHRVEAPFEFVEGTLAATKVCAYCIR